MVGGLNGWRVEWFEWLEGGRRVEWLEGMRFE